MNVKALIVDLAEWVEQVADFQRHESKQQRMQVTVKEKETDYVTDVDLKSEAMLIQFIRTKYPDHGILTEERGKLEGSGDYQWVIDPIDGTTNFIHGFPMSSISVALQHRGVTVAGMVCAPWIGMKFHAVKGEGAYMNGQRLEVSRTSELKHSLLATGFPNGLGQRTFNLAYFNRMIDKVSGIRRTGSAALDLCFVAASYLDGYWEFDLKEWDLCAGALIAEEAGAVLRRMDIQDHALLICSNPEILPALREGLLKSNPNTKE